MWECRNAGKLTALSVKIEKETRRHGDGDGLYLHVAPNGTKLWVLRIVINDRCRDIGLGAFPIASLAKARSLAAENRSAVAEGRDPLAEKREAKDAARSPAPSVPTFAEAARPRDRVAPTHMEEPETRWTVEINPRNPRLPGDGEYGCR